MRRIAIALSLLAAACQGAIDPAPGAGGKTPAGSATDKGGSPARPSTGAAGPARDRPAGETPIGPAPSAPAGFDHSADLAEIPKEDVQAYARRLAPLLARRAISPGEIAEIEAQGGKALRSLLAHWTEQPAFAVAAREMLSLQLGASGKKDGIDFDLPGNLAAHVARNRLPFETLLTADHCVDAQGGKVACDTGAPYGAGVIGTRAFLIGAVGRFNLRRARVFLKTFSCLDYPLEQRLEPSLPREALQPLFRANSIDEQTDLRAIGGFGNGFGCYDCHSQFGAHAQLFVKFDATGVWHANATGEQDPMGELGRGPGEMFASHLAGGAAGKEETQFFGKRVGNLREAALALAQNERFLPCSTRALLRFGLALPESIAHDLPSSVVADIVSAATAAEPQPSLQRLALEAFSHPAIVRSLRVSPADWANETTSP
jgi:hypothetical protein